MASLGGNISPPESIISPQIFVAGLAGVVFFTIGFYQLSSKHPQDGTPDEPSVVKSILLFIYSCFLKPHSHAAQNGQQGALESFYAGQAGAYDVTRKALLKGREDMLALAAAQLRFKAEKQDGGAGKKRIWVDVGGGI